MEFLRNLDGLVHWRKVTGERANMLRLQSQIWPEMKTVHLVSASCWIVRGLGRGYNESLVHLTFIGKGGTVAGGGKGYGFSVHTVRGSVQSTTPQKAGDNI